MYILGAYRSAKNFLFEHEPLCRGAAKTLTRSRSFRAGLAYRGALTVSAATVLPDCRTGNRVTRYTSLVFSTEQFQKLKHKQNPRTISKLPTGLIPTMGGLGKLACRNGSLPNRETGLSPPLVISPWIVQTAELELKSQDSRARDRVQFVVPRSRYRIVF